MPEFHAQEIDHFAVCSTVLLSVRIYPSLHCAVLAGYFTLYTVIVSTPLFPFHKLPCVSRFLSNEGMSLHKQLRDEDAKNKHTSYISEPWFDMYLRDRVPLPINYNPLLVFVDDPKKEYSSQLIRTSNLIIASLR